MTRRLAFALGAAALLAGPAKAHASGADLLLQSVTPTQAPAAQPQGQPPNAAATAQAAQRFPTGELKLNDPFVMQLFASWQGQPGMGFEVNSWVLRILQGKHEEAAHLWSTMEGRIPDGFRQDARAAWLYLLFKLDLAQSFFDEWISAQANPDFSASRAALALDQIIAPGFDRWLVEHALQLSPEQEATIAKLDKSRGFHFLTLQAWASLRKGEQALAILPNLPAEHSLKMPLARTVALALARKGDLAGAAKVLKTELEPAIEAQKDKLALVSHHIQIARLLYQAGVLDGAEEFYLKVPNGAREFLKAREELAWVRLRKGEIQKLRGDLATLATGVFSESFQPEVFLVRAISNLKMCFYDKIDQDFADFRSINAVWAKRIDQALANVAQTPRPEWVDEFGVRAEKALEARAAEAARIEALARASIQVALPAVGEQKHWVQLKERMLAARELGRKARDAEYRRQWLGRRYVLEEAIRKMQFVKVELMSQLRELARLKEMGGDAIRTTAAAPARLEGEKAAEAVKPDPGQMVFPFDGVLWPDELFKLRSVARDRCLERGRL